MVRQHGFFVPRAAVEEAKLVNLNSLIPYAISEVDVRRAMSEERENVRCEKNAA